MTATEVLRRTEDQLRLLGPMMGRLERELLRPVVNRVYDIMERRKMFLDAPEVIAGANLEIRYSSLIARSQKVSEAQNISRAIEASAPFFEIDNASVDNIDSDQAVQSIFRVFGAPQELIRSAEVVEKLRDARQQAQQEALDRQQSQEDTQQISQMASLAGQ